MAEFQLRDFFKELFSMKKIVCISVILSVIACAGIGYYRFKRTQTGDQKEIIETYEKSMKNFDEAIKGIESNINMTQAQIDVQQKFIDNALFLKIDSSNVQVAEISYIIETDLVGEDKIKGLIGIYKNATDFGQIESEIKKALPEYESLVIDNIIMCAQSGNNINVRVHHYDMVEAKKILEVVEKSVESLKKDIAISHTLTKVNKQQYVMASDWLRKKQIDAQNELKWNKNTLADYKRKYADFQNSKTYYERMNKPVLFVSASPVKTLIKYSAFGVFLGLLWPVLWIFYKKLIIN
jgi:hypothetical protein